jgi:hypothetical protein
MPPGPSQLVLQSFLTPGRECEVDACSTAVLIAILDSSDRHLCCRADEVVKDVHCHGRGLDMREVPDSDEYLKPTPGHGVVGGVTAGGWDDPVLVTPNLAKLVLLR